MRLSSWVTKSSVFIGLFGTTILMSAGSALAQDASSSAELTTSSYTYEDTSTVVNQVVAPEWQNNPFHEIKSEGDAKIIQGINSDDDNLIKDGIAMLVYVSENDAEGNTNKFQADRELRGLQDMGLYTPEIKIDIANLQNNDYIYVAPTSTTNGFIDSSPITTSDGASNMPSSLSSDLDLFYGEGKHIHERDMFEAANRFINVPGKEDLAIALYVSASKVKTYGFNFDLNNNPSTKLEELSRAGKYDPTIDYHARIGLENFYVTNPTFNTQSTAATINPYAGREVIIFNTPVETTSTTPSYESNLTLQTQPQTSTFNTESATIATQAENVETSHNDDMAKWLVDITKHWDQNGITPDENTAYYGLYKRQMENPAMAKYVVEKCEWDKQCDAYKEWALNDSVLIQLANGNIDAEAQQGLRHIAEGSPETYREIESAVAVKKQELQAGADSQRHYVTIPHQTVGVSPLTQEFLCTNRGSGEQMNMKNASARIWNCFNDQNNQVDLNAAFAFENAVITTHDVTRTQQAKPVVVVEQGYLRDRLFSSMNLDSGFQTQDVAYLTIEPSEQDNSPVILASAITSGGGAQSLNLN